MGIVETKVLDVNIQSTALHCFPRGWCFTHNYSSGPVARIIFGWDVTKLQVSAIQSFDQFLVMDVQILETQMAFLVFHCLWS